MRVPPLPHTCSVARGGTEDSFGQPGTLPTVASAVRCYWWSGTPSTTSNGDSAGVVAIENEHVWVSRDTTVRQGDHVHTLVDETGRTIIGTADHRVVAHVVVHRSYLDCVLRYGKGIGGQA